MKKRLLVITSFLAIILLVSCVSAADIVLWSASDGFTSTNWAGGGGEAGKSGNGCLYGSSQLDVGGHNSYCYTKDAYIGDLTGNTDVTMSIDVRYHGGGWDSSGDRIVFSVASSTTGGWKSLTPTPWTDGAKYDGKGWITYTRLIPDSYIGDNFMIKILQDCNEEGKEDAWYDNIVLSMPCVPEEEVRDGADNDCDELIDENEAGVEYGLWPFGNPDETTLDDGNLGYWNFNSPDSTSNVAADFYDINNGDVIPDTAQVDSDIIGQGYEFYGDDTIDFSTITSLSGSRSWWQKNCDEDVWHFYVVNNDGTVYVDGEAGSLSSDVMVVNGNLVLGDGFCGIIDEMSVWTRDLTITEITELYEYYFLSQGLTVPVMGNGITEINEEADDGNTENGDGVDENGNIEDGWRCAINEDGLAECCQDECTVLDRTCLDAGVAGTRECTLDEPPVCNQYEEDWTTTECDQDAGELCLAGFCVPPGEQPIRFCSDIVAENPCENAIDDNPDVCVRSVNDYLFDKVSYLPAEMPSDFCDTGFPLNPSPVDVTPLGRCNYYAEDCACKWDDGVESGNDEGCGQAYTQMIECNLNGEITPYYGECVFSTTSKVNECETTGYITYTRAAVWTSEDGVEALEGTCDDYTKQYECVEVAELPFFTFASFIISCMIVIGIYTYYIRREGK